MNPDVAFKEDCQISTARLCKGMLKSISLSLVLATLVALPGSLTAGESKKLVLIAGKPSHPPLMHEFRAGCFLLQQCLKGVEGLSVEVHTEGWVSDETVLQEADAIVIFADGGGRHPALQGNHMKTLDALGKKGVGSGCMHYGVEVPPDKGADEMVSWIGGRYEHMFSCNPMWEPSFKEFPKHPVTQGVGPFQIKDEWYFNMRFVGGVSGNEPSTHDSMTFTPILIGKPSEDVRDGPYVYPKGPYPHIISSKGRLESMLWVVERKDGGRGFGFTGGHFHMNWGNDDFRKVVLNTLVWVAKVNVPESGIESSVSEHQLMANLDWKK